MSKVLEIVRFTVKPELEAQFLADRPAFVATMKEHFPGLLSVTLARLEGTQFVDVAQWESKEQAATCAEQSMQIPAIAAFFSTTDRVIAMEHAEVV